MTSKAKKRVVLTIGQKMEILKLEGKVSSKKIADNYGVGKTQIQSVFKRKYELLEEAEKGLNPACKRYKVVAESSDIEEKTFAWFCIMGAMNFPVTTATLQDTAIKIATQQGVDNFKGSNGWLDRFKRRHSILAERLRGERGCVDGDCIEGFKEQLPVILRDYKLEDIFCAHETGLYFRAIPDRSLSEAVVGKDHSITLLLCVSATGVFEKPLMIGKTEGPRCLRNVTLSSLPFTWRSNPNARITTELFRNWLMDLNARMASQCRNIILLLNKSPSHQHLVLSNVRLVFLPENASVPHPLEQGVMRTIKRHYHKRLLRCVIRKTKTRKDCSTVQKSIDLHLAITWLREAICACKPETVKKCFKKSGIDEAALGAAQADPDDDPSGSDIEQLDDEGDEPLSQLFPKATESLAIEDALPYEDYADLAAPTEEVEKGTRNEGSDSTNEDSDMRDNYDDVTSSMAHDDVQEAFDSLRRYFVFSGFSKSTDAIMSAWKVFEKEFFAKS